MCSNRTICRCLRCIFLVLISCESFSTLLCNFHRFSNFSPKPANRATSQRCSQVNYGGSYVRCTGLSKFGTRIKYAKNMTFVGRLPDGMIRYSQK